MFIAMMAACGATDERRAPGEFVDDASITARVKTALVKANNINANAINVNTYRGEVVLSGFVESRDMINRAGDVARGVGGVRAVRNDLHLTPPR
jgi:osmotically-inducible protein OsmY